MATGADNPFDAMTYELKKIEVKRANDKIPLGVFVKSVVSGGQPYICRLTEGSPAAMAGMKIGDFVLSVNGRRIDSKAQMAEEVNRVPEGALNMVVGRRRNPPLDPLALCPPRSQRRPNFLYHICR